MRVEIVYEQGTAEEMEDGFIVNPPFFGAVDGTSGGKLGDGEIVAKKILETFYSAKEKEPLEKVVLGANQNLQNLWKSRNIPLNRTDLLAGAVFVFAKVDSRKIEIIQGGDCFAVIEKQNGKIVATRNQAFSHAIKHLITIADLMKKHHNRKKMWREFKPILAQARLRDVNKKVKNGFCVINGQSNIKKFWQKLTISRKEVKLMLLFTDGLIYYPDSKDERQLARKAIAAYKQGGFGKILKRTRSLEEKVRATSHIDHAEATGLALKF